MASTGRILATLIATPAVLVALGATKPAGGRLVNDRCPVMTDEFTSPLHEIQTHGVTVRFCCAKCRQRFEADPVPYMSRLPQLTPAAAESILADAKIGASARAERADAWLDRWMQPLLLAAAAIVGVWLVVRIARRRRRGRRSTQMSETPLGT